MASSSPVVTPGFTRGPIISRTSAASRPATRIFSTSSGVLMETVMREEEALQLAVDNAIAIMQGTLEKGVNDKGLEEQMKIWISKNK